MKQLPMSMWAKEDLPSEKALQGIDRLSNVELLSIILGTGTKDENVIDLSRRVLKSFNNNLHELAKCDIDQLAGIPGIGKTKATRILATIELGKRRQIENEMIRSDLGTAVRIYNYMAPKVQDLEVEEFWVLMMNQNYKLVKAEKISHGGISETSVDIRIIMKECVLNNATILACCHNHPSGSLLPSKADDQLTRSIQHACQVMRIHFQDHVIIGGQNYYSYHEQGKL